MFYAAPEKKTLEPPAKQTFNNQAGQKTHSGVSAAAAAAAGLFLLLLFPNLLFNLGQYVFNMSKSGQSGFHLTVWSQC